MNAELATKSALGRLKKRVQEIEQAAGAFWKQNVSSIYYKDGNVGIGTSSPDATLNVADASGASGLRLSRTTDNLLIQVPGGVGTPTKFYATGTQALGIYNSTTGQLGRADIGIGNDMTVPNLVFDNSGNSLIIKSTGSTNVAVGTALLELNSTTKGFLPPRMTHEQKQAIASPAEGLMVYDTTLGKLSIWTDPTWEGVSSA
jgi:hypothetical protein